MPARAFMVGRFIWVTYRSRGSIQSTSEFTTSTSNSVFDAPSLMSATFVALLPFQTVSGPTMAR